MNHFYDIANSIANQLRQTLIDKKMPDNNGVIMVYFEVYDKVFAKSYFGEVCQNACYAYPFEMTGRINTIHYKKCSDLNAEQIGGKFPDSPIDHPNFVTAIVKSRTKDETLFKINIAISSAYDELMSEADIKQRTLGAIDKLSNYIYDICGEYCTTCFVF